MSLTWTEVADSRQNAGFSWISQVNIAAFGSSDYVSGGYAVAPAAFGFGEIHGIVEIGYTELGSTPSNYFWDYNYGTKKLQAFNGSGEAANSTDFSGINVKFLGFGF